MEAQDANRRRKPRPSALAEGEHTAAMKTAFKTQRNQRTVVSASSKKATTVVLAVQKQTSSSVRRLKGERRDDEAQTDMDIHHLLKAFAAASHDVAMQTCQAPQTEWVQVEAVRLDHQAASTRRRHSLGEIKPALPPQRTMELFLREQAQRFQQQIKTMTSKLRQVEAQLDTQKASLLRRSKSMGPGASKAWNPLEALERISARKREEGAEADGCQPALARTARFGRSHTVNLGNAAMPGMETSGSAEMSEAADRLQLTPKDPHVLRNRRSSAPLVDRATAKGDADRDVHQTAATQTAWNDLPDKAVQVELSRPLVQARRVRRRAQRPGASPLRLLRNRIVEQLQKQARSGSIRMHHPSDEPATANGATTVADHVSASRTPPPPPPLLEMAAVVDSHAVRAHTMPEGPVSGAGSGGPGVLERVVKRTELWFDERLAAHEGFDRGFNTILDTYLQEHSQCPLDQLSHSQPPVSPPSPPTIESRPSAPPGLLGTGPPLPSAPLLKRAPHDGKQPRHSLGRGSGPHRPPEEEKERVEETACEGPTEAVRE
ncbi:unnamed protein product [Vitrella brassicaformis CCMP3155]|uniref:Uncharacterized protein n=1 Tax=Vitrella brassicaformis (strain CCMP3155) TaxID=1169540 RepID=A0A0G4EUW4_VITBC|nr:unnamed protein product [Vitrella brassicaformis CCMP3155]|eukprot:CEM02244.1 unnamed protein product [Vitrella brassicaformis CCMP3155]